MCITMLQCLLQNRLAVCMIIIQHHITKVHKHSKLADSVIRVKCSMLFIFSFLTRAWGAEGYDEAAWGDQSRNSMFVKNEAGHK